MKVNQMLYAVTDPNWGDPFVIPETVRASANAAMDAACEMIEYGMYSNYTRFSEGRGNWKGLDRQGFKVVCFKLTEVEAEEDIIPSP